MILSNILLIVVIGAVIYMMMKGGGCCGHDHNGRQEEHQDHGPSGKTNNTGHTHHQMNKATFADRDETDPVCGMEIQDHRIESSHLGRTFHFCSEQCRKIFNLNPNKFAGV